MCKEKWKSLRDSYHRNVKRRKWKSGDGATKCKKWKFESQMEFLRPYLQERATKSNIESVGTNMSDDNTYDDNNETSIYDVMPISPEPVNSPLSSSSTATSLMFKNITARKKKQTQLTQKSSVANVLQNYLDSRPVTTSQSIDPGHPIHSFFKAMADAVIALPPDLQLKTKNKIYTIVSDAEYENLTKDSASFTEQPATVVKETTPSTSFQFPETHWTSRPRPQNIQDQHVQNASDNVPGRTNESQVMVELTPGTYTKYVLGEDGILVRQEDTL